MVESKDAISAYVRAIKILNGCYTISWLSKCYIPDVCSLRPANWPTKKATKNYL